MEVGRPAGQWELVPQQVGGYWSQPRCWSPVLLLTLRLALCPPPHYSQSIGVRDDLVSIITAILPLRLSIGAGHDIQLWQGGWGLAGWVIGSVQLSSAQAMVTFLVAERLKAVHNVAVCCNVLGLILG